MLGENIKMYRQKKRFTQEEIANRLHVTRQTISKWEKNYSVPDAEILIKLAEILEVQTSQLLGIKVDDETQKTQEKENACAEQLAHIAEQMAIKNRHSKRLWKTIGIVLAIIIAVYIGIVVICSVFFSFNINTSTQNIQTYEETMELEE
jgi:putative transcriptional regulator